jgi:hypothetical protein
MTLDSSGNLGLGVTPSAWRSGTKAVDLGGGTGLALASSIDSGYGIYQNAFIDDGGDKYKNTGAAARYLLGSGAHRWDIAPSGTAGNAITYTAAMTLDASGNLGIGVTDMSVSGANAKFAVSGAINLNDGNAIAWGGGTGRVSIIGNKSTGVMNLAASGGVIQTLPAGLGYGTGAGGTVTQATSKSTNVTLNKPCGQITMHNAALAVGESVSFQLTNSLVTINDAVTASLDATVNYDYILQAYVNAGTIQFRLLNNGSVSRSEAVRIHFAIIKGATS